MINYDRQIDIKITKIKLEEANQKTVYLKKNARRKLYNYKHSKKKHTHIQRATESHRLWQEERTDEETERERARAKECWKRKKQKKGKLKPSRILDDDSLQWIMKKLNRKKHTNTSTRATRVGVRAASVSIDDGVLQSWRWVVGKENMATLVE